MYLTGKDNAKFGMVFDAFWIPLAIMAGQAIAGALKKKGERNAAQGQADYDARKEENKFLAENPNFAESAAMGRRFAGSLSEAWNPAMSTHEVNGKTFNLPGLDFSKLFANMNAGQFGQDLKSATPKDIKRPDFTPQKIGGSFLGDLGMGAAQGAMNYAGNRWGGMGGGISGGGLPQGGSFGPAPNVPGPDEREWGG